uniref:hypothetical protein n=1 Tax=Actinotalea sp. C106 TaxID=2908644 RepID=UPI002028BDEC
PQGPGPASAHPPGPAPSPAGRPRARLDRVDVVILTALTALPAGGVLLWAGAGGLIAAAVTVGTAAVVLVAVRVSTARDPARTARRRGGRGG